MQFRIFVNIKKKNIPFLEKRFDNLYQLKGLQFIVLFFLLVKRITIIVITTTIIIITIIITIVKILTWWIT